MAYTDLIYPSKTDEKGRVNFWSRQIDYALRRMEPYFKVGNELVKLYNNRPATTRETARDDTSEGMDNIARVKSNIIFAWVDQTKSNMLDRAPAFKVSAKNSSSVDGAQVVKTVSDYWYGETSQFYHDGKILDEAFLMPYGVKKIGWNARLDEADEISLMDVAGLVEDNPFDAANLLAGGTVLRAGEGQDHEAHIEAATELLQDPTIDDQIKSDVIEPYIAAHRRMLERPSPGTHATVQYEAPYGVHWRSKDFALDGLARHGILDARWVGFRWQLPYPDVMSNPNYDREALKTLEPNAAVRPVGAPEEMSELGFDDFGLVEGWEIWARNFPVSLKERNNLLITLVPGHDKLLQHEYSWPYENIEDFPCEILQFHDNVDGWAQHSTIHLGGGDNIQKLMHEFMDSMLSVVRKQKNLFFFDKDMFDQETIDQILQLPDGSAIPVEGLAQAQGKPIIALPFQQVPEEKGSLVGIIMNQFDRALGTPQPIRTQSPETATEASIIEKRNTAREESRLNRFKQMQINTARKFWQLHSQYRPEREFLIDPRVDKWANVNEEIAKGEYQFQIDISSRAISQAVERKTFSDLLNLTAGLVPIFLQLYKTAPNLLQIYEDLLRRGFDIQDTERYLPANPSDMQRQLTEILQNPGQADQIVRAMTMLRGGGNGVAANSPGPILPQQFAAKPTPPGENENTMAMRQ